jgi:hypothetical protein
MVTRLGEFSPIGRLFTLGSFAKITEAHYSNNLITFSHGKIYGLVKIKRVGLLWAIFSQPHLVTLFERTCEEADSMYGT